jgi:hypothetical protein
MQYESTLEKSRDRHSKSIRHQKDGATRRSWARLVVGVGLILAATATATAGGKTLYVYELPDGSRMVSDHRLDPRRYRLVRVGSVRDQLGKLAASQDSQFFRAASETYDPLIRAICERYEVDFALVKAIMHAESGFNPYARSQRGALGLMQLMPATAQRYGVDDLYTPSQNIEAGVRHLKFLLELFDNRLSLAIAAYNAGENAVFLHRGIPPYPETQEYVRKVLRLRRLYRQASSSS